MSKLTKESLEEVEETIRFFSFDRRLYDQPMPEYRSKMNAEADRLLSDALRTKADLLKNDEKDSGDFDLGTRDASVDEVKDCEACE